MGWEEERDGVEKRKGNWVGEKKKETVLRGGRGAGRGVGKGKWKKVMRERSKENRWREKRNVKAVKARQDNDE